MDSKYNKLRELTSKSMAVRPKDRLTCKEWLCAKNDWGIDFEEVRHLIPEQINIMEEYDINKEFCQLFLSTKYTMEK